MLSSTCDESIQYIYGRELHGPLVGSYRFEDSYCVRTSPSEQTDLNFDLPFAMSLHHGQVIVKIEASQIQSRGIIKLQGIEDTGKPLFLRMSRLFFNLPFSSKIKRASESTTALAFFVDNLMEQQIWLHKANFLFDTENGKSQLK